jgi:hypothetical protein
MDNNIGLFYPLLQSLYLLPQNPYLCCRGKNWIK